MGDFDIVCLQEFLRIIHFYLFKKAQKIPLRSLPKNIRSGPVEELVIFSKVPLTNVDFYHFHTPRNLCPLYTKLAQQGILFCTN